MLESRILPLQPAQLLLIGGQTSLAREDIVWGCARALVCLPHPCPQQIRPHIQLARELRETHPSGLPLEYATDRFQLELGTEAPACSLRFDLSPPPP